MAVSAGTAIGAGVAMAAGATAAAIRAQQMKTKARKSFYGGSQQALDAQRESYATGVDQGNAGYQAGVQGLSQAGQNAQGMVARGNAVMDTAGGVTDSSQARTMLAGYQPGAISAAAAKAAADQAFRQNLSAGRTGGALGLRDALYANSASGQQIAQQAAVQRAQEEQAILAARVAQENADRDAAFGRTDMRLKALGLGSQIAQGANAQAISAGGTAGQLGLTNQGQYLGQMATADQAQLSADTDYDRRRQQDQQRKAQNLWGLAGTLTGGAAKAFGSMG